MYLLPNHQKSVQMYTGLNRAVPFAGKPHIAKRLTNDFQPLLAQVPLYKKNMPENLGDYYMSSLSSRSQRQVEKVVGGLQPQEFRHIAERGLLGCVDSVADGLSGVYAWEAYHSGLLSKKKLDVWRDFLPVPAKRTPETLDRMLKNIRGELSKDARLKQFAFHVGEKPEVIGKMLSLEVARNLLNNGVDTNSLKNNVFLSVQNIAHYFPVLSWKRLQLKGVAHMYRFLPSLSMNYLTVSMMKALDKKVDAEVPLSSVRAFAIHKAQRGLEGKFLILPSKESRAIAALEEAALIKKSRLWF